MWALNPPMTAAFDTVDHELLLLRLERQFGLCDTVLEWFRSYLCGRSFRVLYGGSVSYIVHILCSVPQGSVLGPRMFILYSADLVDIAEKHGVTIHSFADDTQLYLPVVAMKRHKPLSDSSSALQTSTTGCQPTD